METKIKQGGAKPKTRSTMTMIEPFAGELGKVPIPMELALNYCSHKCGYCFANLNQPDRQADVNAIMNSIKRSLDPNKEATNIVSQMLREKRPVTMSNRVDPFATSNYQIATPLIELLTQFEIPIYFQTKGGQGKAHDSLIHIATNVVKKPSLWYVTLAQDDDAKSKQIEPAAPSITKRLQMIDFLINQGHNVLVGFNPLVKEWADYKVMAKMLKDHGVQYLFINPLHFAQKQVDRLSEREINAMNMGSGVIERTLARYKWNFEKQGNNPDFDYVHEAIQYFESEGFIATVGIEARENHIYDIYHSTYAKDGNLKTFLTIQDFVNYCFQTKKAGDVIEFAEFAAFLTSSMPQGEFNLQTYIVGLDRFFLTANQREKNGFYDEKLPIRMDFVELLSYYWRFPSLKASLLNIDCFYPKLEGLINDQPIPDLDEFGMLKVVFDPNERETPYYV